MDEKRGKGIPFVRGSETSADAADSVARSSGALRHKVYAFIKSRGSEGATDEEVQIKLDMSPSTQRPRRRELEQQRKVAKQTKDGKRVTRRTKSGRKAGVWCLPEYTEELPVFHPDPAPRPVPTDMIPQVYRDLTSALARLQFVANMNEMEFSGAHGDLPSGSDDVTRFRRDINQATEAVHAAARKLNRHLNPVLPKEDTYPIAVYYKNNPLEKGE